MDQEIADHIIEATIDPVAVQRELDAALARTASMGQAIEAHLDDAERELAEIKRNGLPQGMSL
jgi:uncharacterized sporulation protein YeaH/YhbH (DUF444 family)